MSTPAPYIKFPVMSGDTLGNLASRLKVSLSNLMLWNPQVKNPNLIKVGDLLVVRNNEVTRKFAAARKVAWDASIGAQQNPTPLDINGGTGTGLPPVPLAPSGNWFSNPWILGGLGVALIALFMGKK